jgi:hypothetical protein
MQLLLGRLPQKEKAVKRFLIFFLVMLVCSLSFPVSAPASKPVTQTLEGCVIKGVFYSVEKGVATKTGPRTQIYRMEAKKPDFSPYDLSPYEGKNIRVQGRLHPGDLFMPDPKTLKVLGPCDQESKDAICQSEQ